MSNKNSTVQNGQPKGQGQAHMTSTQSGDEVKSHEPDKLNREEIEKLKSLLGALEKLPETGTCSLAFKSKFSSLYALNVSCTTFPNSWVIDSSATDHMTHSSHKFIIYDPCPSNRKISTADGSLSTVAGQGNVLINQALTLKNVLHVPNLSTNLLSIHKLTKDLNCNVIFYPSYCIFQDQGTGKMIGHAREKNGLYYLEESSGQTRTGNYLPLSYFSESSISNKDKI